MGRFFSSVQIKNNGSSEQFLKAFCAVMKKRNLVQCSEEESSVSYILAFSESGKWVTLNSEKYGDNPKQAKYDAQQTAAEMKTSSFSMDVVDSYWAYIELHTGADIHDTVVVGRSEFDEEHSPKGRRECWEPILAPGKTWEQLSEIWNKDEVFVEYALYEAASVLGIEPKYMVSDYEDFESEADEDTNIIPIFFKKKITVSEGGEKKLTLNAAFKQVFGEALEPLGFKKIKGRQPYFVRLIGDEIIHVITYMSQPDKRFIIIGGVATVYRQFISLDQSPRNNSNWLRSNWQFFKELHPSDKNTKYSFKDIYEFYYSDETLVGEIKYSLEVTKDIMLPIFNKIVDLDSCVEYFDKFKLYMQLYDEKTNFGNKYVNNFYNEGLLYLKIDDQDNIIRKLEERLNIISYNVEKKRFEYTQKDCDDISQKLENLKKIKPFNVSELFAKELLELQQRKTLNTEILHSYGLDL